MKIPAKSDDGKMYFLKLDDIQYITVYQKKIMIFTQDCIYHAPNTINDYLELTKDYGFTMLDRNNVAQVSKITRYDPVQKIAFFDGEDRACTVSGSNGRILEKFK